MDDVGTTTGTTGASVVRWMWDWADEEARHVWRRSRFLSGRDAEILGVPAVVPPGAVTVYLPQVRMQDIPMVAAICAAELDVGPRALALELFAAQADILPFVLVAATSLEDAIRLVVRLVGVAAEIVPCDPDPTWCNDRDWSAVPLWVSQGEILVRAEGFWDPMPRRRWSLVGPTGASAATTLSRRVVAEAIQAAADEIGREPAQGEIHPAFRRRVARRGAACRTTAPASM